MKYNKEIIAQLIKSYYFCQRLLQLDERDKRFGL